MRHFRKLIMTIALGLLGFSLFSCNSVNSREIPSNGDGKESYRLIAFVDEGDGQLHKIDVQTTNLRAGGTPQQMGSAVVMGLGTYFHNDACEIGINPSPTSGKRVKTVIFKYDAGVYSPSVLPTTISEFEGRTKPINPSNYQVNFRFNVVGDVYMYVTMENAEGVDVDPEDYDEGVDVGTEDYDEGVDVGPEDYDEGTL